MRPLYASLVLFLFVAAVAEEKKDDGFTPLFNGKDLTGWKANENPDSFKVVDGCIVANAKPRSHLFYVGDEKPFKDFELKADVMTMPNSNAGIYFHTKFQDTGWPKYGFECQVNNSYKDPQKTASLYGVVPITEAPAKDNEWFEMHITVKGKKVTIAVNGKTIVDYTEKDDAKAGKDFTRVLDQGTFALQGHDPGSTVKFKNIRAKRLD